uniref:site-specific DNA-methyltransferase (cytosine-N(4)-specific) n=1 Tax=viral metagenome TaxID=1070528 RepID=A0A6M3IHF6_9ZZZZ
MIDTIIQGDCLNVMRGMGNNSVDLTVTSPPYDNLRDYKGYTFDFEGIAQQLYRVTKPGGVVVWVVGDATINGSETGTSFKQALYFKEIGFNLHDTMIYKKIGVGSSGSNKSYPQSFEYMFVFSKGTPSAINLIKDVINKEAGELRRYAKTKSDKNGYKPEITIKEVAPTTKRDNVWYYNIGFANKSDTTIHPASFPESLARDHILSWSNEGDLVLDPMCGFGTTCKMALVNDRHYLGIDISEEYCEIARQRVADAKMVRDSQPELFGR